MKRSEPYLGHAVDWSHYRTARRSGIRRGDFASGETFYRVVLDIMIAAAWFVGVVGVGCAAWTLVSIVFSLERM